MLIIEKYIVSSTQIKIMDRNINSKETRLLQSQIHSDTEA